MEAHYDKPMYIEFGNENGVYRVESHNQIPVFEDVMNFLVKPALLAAGYTAKTVEDWFDAPDGDTADLRCLRM